MKTIPDKTRKEWQELVTGRLNVPLQNFFFQMKLTQTKNLLAKDKISVETAVEDIYNLCVKFSKAKNMDKDIEAIFGSQETVEKTEKLETTTIIVDDAGEFVVKDTPSSHSISEISSDKNKLTKDELTNNSNETDQLRDIKEELERIKREAAIREAEFRRKRIEFQEKLAIETRARKEAIRSSESGKITQKAEEQKAIQKKLAGERMEKEALKKVSEIKKKKQHSKKQSPKKRTFLQKFFNIK